MVCSQILGDTRRLCPLCCNIAWPQSTERFLCLDSQPEELQAALQQSLWRIRLHFHRELSTALQQPPAWSQQDRPRASEAQPGLQRTPNALGNGAKPLRGTGGPTGHLQDGTEPSCPSRGHGAKHIQDQQRGQGHGLGLLPAKSSFIHSTAPSAPAHPLPKTTARKLPAVSAPVTVPQSNWFAVSQGTWVIFPLI